MLAQGHVQARKRVSLFLTAFVITGFFSKMKKKQDVYMYTYLDLHYNYTVHPYLILSLKLLFLPRFVQRVVSISFNSNDTK